MLQSDRLRSYHFVPLSTALCHAVPFCVNPYHSVQRFATVRNDSTVRNLLSILMKPVMLQKNLQISLPRFNFLTSHLNCWLKPGTLIKKGRFGTIDLLVATSLY
jgi:hypothetical protein